jgi:putative ABC transport system permease protein
MELRPILSAMRRRKTGVILIALQVALTLAILANGLHVVRDRFDESRRISGLDEAQVFHVRVLDKERDTTGAVTQADVDALRALPGITAAVLVNQVPLSNSGNNSGFHVIPDFEQSLSTAATYIADPGLVETYGLRIIEGRDFRPEESQLVDQEKDDQARVSGAIVTRDMAKALFPNEERVVGKHIYWGDDKAIPIIGVVETLVTPWGRSSWGGGDGSRSVIFPARLVNERRTYAVRVEDPAQLRRLATEADAMLSKRIPGRLSAGVFTMAETRNRRYEGEHTMINGLLIVMALLLAMTASGIVGLASLWVNQRRKQIGVRRALGARRFDIVRYFLVENLVATGLGVLVGAGLAIALNAAMMGQLELTRLPAGFVAVGAAMLLGLGLLAVLGPALRAAAVPPAVATRSV